MTHANFPALSNSQNLNLFDIRTFPVLSNSQHLNLFDICTFQMFVRYPEQLFWLIFVDRAIWDKWTHFFQLIQLLLLLMLKLIQPYFIQLKWPNSKILNLAASSISTYTKHLSILDVPYIYSH